MKHVAILLLAIPLASRAQDTLEEPDRPWNASLQLLRPVGTDNPFEGSLDLSRSILIPTVRGDLTLDPGVSGAVGTSDADTTWSFTPRLAVGWERGALTASLQGNAQMRSWDENDYAFSGALGWQIAPTVSWGASAGTSWLSGDWARTTVGWSATAEAWSAGASLGIGYLWDVEVTSQGKGSRTDKLRTTVADQWQAVPALQVARRWTSWSASLHLDADARTYERTKGGGKGKMASGTSGTVWAWNVTVDPWADLGWSQGAWGADLSGGWSQGLGTGASDGGAWAAVSSSFSW